MIKEKIIKLIPSKTMREFLTKDPERITPEEYICIIADLPIKIESKIELLNECYSEWSSISETIKQYIEFLETALNELDHFDRSNEILILNEIENKYNKEYPEDHRDCNPREYIDSKPVLSYKNAVNILNGNIYDVWSEAKNESEDFVITVSESDLYGEDYVPEDTGYMELELYKISESKCKLEYTYTLNSRGNILYINAFDNTSFTNIFNGGNTKNLPVPYKTSDILYADGRPFYNPNHFLICDVDKSGDIQCLFKTRNGYIKTGSFRNGHYCDTSISVDKYMSLPLFAEICDDDKDYEKCGCISRISRHLSMYPIHGRKLTQILKEKDCTPEQTVVELQHL